MVYERYETVFIREMDVSKLSKKNFEDIKEIVAKKMDLDVDDIEVIYYYMFPNGFESKIRVTKDVENNFTYIITVTIIAKNNPKILIEGKLKKNFKIPLLEKISEYPSILKDIIDNIYSSITFKDYLSLHKNKVEEICKRIYEEIEIYLGLNKEYEK